LVVDATGKNRGARARRLRSKKRQVVDLVVSEYGCAGTIILVFIVIHLKDSGPRCHGRHPELIMWKGRRDIYEVVAHWFAVDGTWRSTYSDGRYVSLVHGFVSAFQTLGLNHLKYNPGILIRRQTFSIVGASLVCVLIPIMMYFNS